MLKDDVSHDIIEICWNKKLKLDSFERPNKFLFQMWGLATSQQTTFHLMTLGVILTHDLALALEQFRLYIKAYFTWAVLLAQLVICFGHQRSVVRIQSSAILFIINIIKKLYW